MKSERRSAAARRGWETRRERDEAVAVNVPADQRALWNRVRAAVRGETPHARFEAFTKYVEEHPSEVVATLQEDADRALDAMLAARDAADWARLPADESE